MLARLAYLAVTHAFAASVTAPLFISAGKYGVLATAPGEVPAVIWDSVSHPLRAEKCVRAGQRLSGLRHDRQAPLVLVCFAPL